MKKLTDTAMHKWFMQATKAERQQMADLVGVTYMYVRALAFGYRAGPWEVVMRMAWAARKVRAESDAEAQKRLPDVQRGDVSPICAECGFYKTCQKAGIKEVSE